MKILQINKFYYRRGGAENHFLDLCELLESRGDTVVPFAMKHPKNLATPYDKYFVSNIDLDKPGLSSLVRGGRIFYSFEAKRKISDLIGVEKPDIAHAHLIYHQLSPSILVALKKKKIPVVMTLSDWKLICPNYLLYTEDQICTRCKNKKYRQAWEHCCADNSCWKSAIIAAEAYFHHARRYYEDLVDVFIAPSEFVKKMFVDFGWPAEKIQVLPYFLSPKIKCVNKPSLAPEQPRFAFVGRLEKVKGIQELIESWVAQNIPYNLDVYGDGPLLAELKDFVKKTGQKNIILHGFVDREEINKKIAKEITALIVPSIYYETFGLITIEAWAKGVPVLANDCGVLAELVKKSGAGLLFDVKSGDDLLEKLEKIQAPVYRERAVKYMSGNHGEGEYYERIIGVYKGLI